LEMREPVNLAISLEMTEPVNLAISLETTSKGFSC
jgi:hypothetical protein